MRWLPYKYVVFAASLQLASVVETLGIVQYLYARRSPTSPHKRVRPKYTLLFLIQRRLVQRRRERHRRVALERLRVI